MGGPTMSEPLIVAVPKKQPLSHGTAARGKLDAVANVTECASHALAASLHARWVLLLRRGRRMEWSRP